MHLDVGVTYESLYGGTQASIKRMEVVTWEVCGGTGKSNPACAIGCTHTFKYHLMWFGGSEGSISLHCCRELRVKHEETICGAFHNSS